VRSSKEMKIFTMFLGIIFLVYCVGCLVSKSYAEELNFTLSIESKLETDLDSSIEPTIRELSIDYKKDNLTFFSTIDDSAGTMTIDEVSYNFHMYDLDWRLGKTIVPFGYDYLERVNSSVFITAPTASNYGYGLHMSTGYDILQAESFIDGESRWSAKGTLRLFNDGITTTFSYTDINEIVNEYGNWSITNKFLYSSLFLNLSLLTEYLPDNGGFWTRSVISPGVFDLIGVFGGYYNLDGNIAHGLDNYIYQPDSWVYGGYVDISKETSLSIEFKSDRAFSPMFIRLTTKF